MKWKHTIPASRYRPWPTVEALCIRHEDTLDPKGDANCRIEHVETIQGKGFRGTCDLWGSSYVSTQVALGTDQAAWDQAHTLLKTTVAKLAAEEAIKLAQREQARKNRRIRKELMGGTWSL